MHKSLGELFRSGQNNFNLIRLISALLVIYGHASVVTGGGEPDLILQYFGYKFVGGIAVDVFFVLSGFLITASIHGGNGISYYISSRVLRIFPALLVCVIMSVIVLGIFYSHNFTLFSVEVWRYIWVNSSAVNTEYFIPGIFEGRPNEAVNGSLWSIPVEVRMYIFVLLLYAGGVFKRKLFFNGLFFVSLVLFYFDPTLLTSHLLHSTHLGVVAMFFIGSFYWVNRNEIVVHPFVLLCFLSFAATMHGTPKFPFAYTLLLPYVIWCVAFIPGLFSFNKIGDYSYGAYLYGWPVQQMVAASVPSMSSEGNALTSCLLALLCGILSWRIVEKPMLKFKIYLKKEELSGK